jgi:glycosyltransferase involved in cell wall biosynthesis
VDLSQFHPSSTRKPEKPLIAFVGAMDWEPNIDGAEYFCAEIWPKVRARVPNAVFRLVGRNPDRRVQRLGSDSVEITGRVPSVVEHLWEAAAVIVPLRIGGGTRLKIYEAMAAGRAVVSTTVGAEGLDVQHGEDIVLADDPNAFAGAVIQLLTDLSVRQRYEAAAVQSAARHDWPAIGECFANVLASVAARTPGAVAQPALVGRPQSSQTADRGVAS